MLLHVWLHVYDAGIGFRILTSELGSYIGIMEKKMETIGIIWGYIGDMGIMEKKIETTILYGSRDALGLQCCLGFSGWV